MLIAWPLLHVSLALSSTSPFGRTAKNVATQILQGAGPPAVDLNQYNVDLSRIEREWTVNLVQSVNEQQARVAPAVKSQDLYVDTVTVTYKRGRNAGLGIELEELLGGRGDGIGITLVSGVVAGGPLDGGYDVLAGDMLAQVAVVSRGRSVNSETEREVSVRTECLDYEATVDAVRRLPEQCDDEEDVVLTLRRIRRKPKVKVKLQYPPSQGEVDATLELFAGENLRLGMLVRGVKLNDPLAKRFDTKNGGNCGAGGLCRTCAVAVVKGKELLNEQNVAERQMLQDSPRWRFACKAIVGYGMHEGEMTIRVNPRQW
jgi:2Fe-2S iron-sulfur cluster binding domain